MRKDVDWPSVVNADLLIVRRTVISSFIVLFTKDSLPISGLADSRTIKIGAY